jgi:hypothetical protein
MASVTRTDEWYRRTYFPSGSAAPLGAGYETWILDPTRYQGHDELRARAAAVGRHWTKRDLAYELAENLLSDVLGAAGGVEHSIFALREAIGRAQAWSDQITPRPTPMSVPHGISDASVVDAWYEFANLLSWARVLEERLDRRPDKRSLPRQGLAPALKPVRLKKRVDKLLADLRAGPIGETRSLANFTLHSVLIRSPISGAQLDQDGKVTLPIPDRQVGPISHWKVLTWSDHRDGIVFAEDLWASVETFMAGLIEAFERAVPKRFRRGIH